MDNADCSGSERSLAFCRFRGFGQENCDHSEDQREVLLSLVHQVFTSTCHCTIMYIQKSNLAVKPLFLAYLINFQN